MKNEYVVLLGGSVSGNLYYAAEVFSSLGMKVIVTVSSESCFTILSKSKYVDKCYIIDSTSYNSYNHDLQKIITKITNSENILIYAATDTACLAIAKNRDWYEKYCTLSLPSNKILEEFNHKGVAEFQAQNNGLIIPETFLIKDVSDLSQIPSNIVFPLIIKPNNKDINYIKPFKVKLVHSLTGLYSCFKSCFAPNNSALVQSYIKGSDKNVYYVLFYRSQSGEVYKISGRKILQSPPNGGVMAKGTVENIPKLENITVEFLNRIDYYGIGGIEFKYYNGKFYFIEMSTRMEGFSMIERVSDISLLKISSSDLLKRNNNKYNKKGNSSSSKRKMYLSLYNTLSSRLKYTKRFDLLILDLIGILFNKYSLDMFSCKEKRVYFKYLTSLLKK